MRSRRLRRRRSRRSATRPCRGQEQPAARPRSCAATSPLGREPAARTCAVAPAGRPFDGEHVDRSPRGSSRRRASIRVADARVAHQALVARAASAARAGGEAGKASAKSLRGIVAADVRRVDPARRPPGRPARGPLLRLAFGSWPVDLARRVAWSPAVVGASGLGRRGAASGAGRLVGLLGRRRCRRSSASARRQQRRRRRSRTRRRGPFSSCSGLLCDGVGHHPARSCHRRRWVCIWLRVGTSLDSLTLPHARHREEANQAVPQSPGHPVRPALRPTSEPTSGSSRRCTSSTRRTRSSVRPGVGGVLQDQRPGGTSSRHRRRQPTPPEPRARAPAGPAPTPEQRSPSSRRRPGPTKPSRREVRPAEDGRGRSSRRQEAADARRRWPSRARGQGRRAGQGHHQPGAQGARAAPSRPRPSDEPTLHRAARRPGRAPRRTWTPR